MIERSRRLALLLCLTVSLPGGSAFAQNREWMFGPFEKPRDVNPVLTPDPASTFASPMNDTIVRWQEYATFNPAGMADSRVGVAVWDPKKARR